jgi:SAM-dependent methyltransferase
MVGFVADDIFEHPRSVSIYDALDPDRSDLDVVRRHRWCARRTPRSGRGLRNRHVRAASGGPRPRGEGVDPAGGSLDVARAKPGANRVHWIHSDATTLPQMQVDLVTMTANVAQAVVDPQGWEGTLLGAYDVLRPGGHFVFETRDPEERAWQEWNRAESYSITEIQGVGAVESWVDMVEVSGPLVRLRWTWVFDSDREVLTSDSTLRFRARDEVEAALVASGFTVDEVRGTPDRPGRELVFFARRPE